MSNATRKNSSFIALPIVSSGTSITDLAKKLKQERISALVVSDSEGQCVSGIVSERDICKTVNHNRSFNIDSLSRVNADKITAGDIMTKDPICAKQTCPPEKIISIMLTRSFRHLPVVDENRCLVRLLDILGIATIIKNEIERQKAAEEEARNRRGWFSKALNMISQFVQNPFFLSTLHTDYAGP
jgi:CBS domain-containing protein